MVTAVQRARRKPQVVALPDRRSKHWLSSALSLSGLLWLGLWFGINTGPWVLERLPRSFLGEIHYGRTLLPLIGLGIALLALLGRATMSPRGVRHVPHVLWPWMGYGLIALLACSTSPRPGHALYWGLSYLAAFVVLWLFVQAPTSRERLDRCRHLNYTTWAIALVLLAALLYIARESLFVEDYGGGLSGYGVVNRVGPTAGVGMVRASGFARFAAIPAIFAFVLAWRGQGISRLLWGTVAVSAMAVVYLMQSRGAILGLVAALAFAMLFIGRRTRVVGVLALLYVAFALVTDAQFTTQSEQVMRHVSRQRHWQEYSLTSGRTRDWEVAFERIADSPLWGWGPQADRYLLRFHVHNTYLYAWLSAGLFGLAFFLGGMIWSWRLLIRAVRERTAQRFGQYTTLVQVGCLLAFFTVRGMPEASGSMFGIDLLLMLPAIAWLGALSEAADSADASEEAEAGAEAA